MITTLRKKDIPISIVQGHLKRRFFRNNAEVYRHILGFVANQEERAKLQTSHSQLLIVDY